MNNDQPFSAPPTIIPNKRRTGVRWWLILSIFGVPVLLMMLVGFVFRVGYTIRENSGRAAMSVEVEKLASEGNNIDDETTAMLYDSRTSDENLDEWLELLAKIDSPEFKKTWSGIPLFDRTIEDEHPFRFVHDSDWKYAQTCKSFTANHQELIEKARELSALPTPVQFPIYFQSIETLLPEVQSVRELARLVLIDSQVAVHERDNKRAIQNILTLYGLANQVDAVPSIVSRLVGISIRRIALEALQSCIYCDLLPDDQLMEIDKKLKDYCEIENRWRDTISEELGLNLPVFTNPSLVLKSKKPLPARGHDAVYFIGLMKRAMELNTDNWPAFYAAAKKLESELETDSKSMLQSVDRLLSHLLAPAIAATASVWINHAQLHRQGRLAIAIRLHEHQFKKLPADLNELSSETQKLRPFGSKPFGYKLENGNANLWGFDLSKDVNQTPESPPPIDAAMPNATDNSRLVWEFVPSTKR